MEKLKLALYWAASCGGCEIAQLEIGEKILKLDPENQQARNMLNELSSRPEAMSSLPP